MSRLSRFLPKFLRGDKDKSPSPSNNRNGDKNHCKIIFLEDTEYFIPFKGGLKGQYVLDKAFDQLNLFEKDYFGLRYIDCTGQTHWLDNNKTLSSQLKGCTVPYTFYFGVKFYPADPCKLKEEITRYQFFLQIKKDVLHGRLPVSFEEAAELFAYAVQSEIGDYDSQHLPPGYVSEFQFVPNQTESLEEQIAALHRRLGGTIPATAELKFLDKVKWLDMYGVDLHPVMGDSNTEYFLGLTPTGIVVYKNKTKVGNYFWPRITKVNFKGKVFTIKVKDKISDAHTYAFELPTKAACKHLWKCCVEHHAFFRLNQLGSSSSRTSQPFRSTSKHRNSGRQDRQTNIDQNAREQPRVLRVQSRRQARRALSDTRLNQDSRMMGDMYTEGHVTMIVPPEHNKGSRHHSLPDLKTRESPTSTRSAPWEANVDVGLYTSGRESPISVTQSENVNNLRRQHRETDIDHRRKYGYDSDGGQRQKHHVHTSYSSYSQFRMYRRSGFDSDPNRSSSSRKYFPSSRKGSDNESDASLSRQRRKEADSGSESDISPSLAARQSAASTDQSEWQTTVQKKSALHSAPLGEARQKKMRRRRSKSPSSSKRPPEELREHIEFDLIEPPEDVTEDQLREIPYVNVETKAEPFKVKYSPSNRRRYRSPKRRSGCDIDMNIKGELNDLPVTLTEPNRIEMSKSGGYLSDTGSFSKRQPLMQQPLMQQPLMQQTPYTQQQYNNTMSTNSKSFVTDIRCIPHFHDNLLFYDPQNSPRYSGHNYYPVYNPPSSAVFKPIDIYEQKMIDRNYPNSNSMHSMDNKKSDRVSDINVHSMDGVETNVDATDNYRNPDAGLNVIRGNNSAAAHTPPRSAQIFRTQDDIARLYSSAAAVRRPTFEFANQSAISANQAVSGNKNYVDAKLISGYNHPVSTAEASVPRTNVPAYTDILDNVHASTNISGRILNQPRGGYHRDQHNNPYSSNPTAIQHPPSLNVNQPTSVRNEPNKKYYNNSDGNVISTRESNVNIQSDRPVPSSNMYTYKSPQYNHSMLDRNNAQGYINNSVQTQSNSVYSPIDNQSQAGKRSGLQQTRQYVSSGGVKYATTDVQHDHYKTGQTENSSQFTLPQSTPLKMQGTIRQTANQSVGNAVTSTINMQGTNRHSTNQMAGSALTSPLMMQNTSRLSSNQNKGYSVISPNPCSPDSAISSLTSSAKPSPSNTVAGGYDRQNGDTRQNLSTFQAHKSNRSSQSKMGDSGFSRVRTPAFGTSDIWTEL